MLKLTDDDISSAIAAYQFRQDWRYNNIFSPGSFQNMRSAAVMIPLLKKDENWFVLLTRRSDSLVEHRGQVSFPGGAWDEQDVDLKQTALREMYEEIGVIPEDVKVLGQLGKIPVITNYLVNLFVGKIPWPYALKLNSDEVNSTFMIPLDWLAKKEHHTVKNRIFEGKEIPVIYFDLYEGYQLWGVSAEMTLILLSAIGMVSD
jgi:8-oxo-dGTP pyrophosphatase MutT (NUDIX family)